MRSNDVFYGLTFDAPFFSFLMQSVYLILKKDDKYKSLELGDYYHFADNLHFYERHFELAEKIKQEDLKDNSTSLILKQPLVDYKDGNVFLTDAGIEFVTRVDQTRGDSDVNYRAILSDYFTL
jgi:thymidylate synthase